jgi:hypothetical protein
VSHLRALYVLHEEVTGKSSFQLFGILMRVVLMQVLPLRGCKPRETRPSLLTLRVLTFKSCQSSGSVQGRRA